MKIYNKLIKHTINLSIFSIIFVVLLTFEDDNTFNLKTNTLRLISPQGYAFFTRNPREPQLYLFKIDTLNRLDNISPNSSTLKMLFGLSRKNRRSALEMNEILQKLTKWKDYSNNLLIQNVPIIDTFELKSKENKNISGKYLIIKEKRIPWAWSKNQKETMKKYKLILIK